MQKTNLFLECERLDRFLDLDRCGDPPFPEPERDRFQYLDFTTYLLCDLLQDLKKLQNIKKPWENY